MTKITDIPAIRFKGFSDTWEQRKLIDVCDYVDYRGKTPTKTDSGVFLVTAKNVKDGYIDYGVSQEYISEDDYEEVMHRGKPEIGDVLITTEAPCGNVAQVNRADIALAQRIIKYRGQSNIVDNTYLKDYLQSPEFQNILNAKSSGGTVKGIKGSILHQQEIKYPKYEEQFKIGSYFNNLDNLITLHQREFAFLCKEKSKKFRYIKNAWEQRKLSEIATMHARIGWQNLRTSEFLDSGDYMLITGTDFIDGAVNFDTCHYVERERYEQDKHIQIRNGSILITKDGTLGKVAYIQGLTMPATLNAGVFNVEIKDENEVDNRYLFQYLKAPFLMDYVDKKATGGTIKHLNQNILVDFPVVLPHKAEQEKIGEYFLAIDHLITLHQRKSNFYTGGYYAE